MVGSKFIGSKWMNALLPARRPHRGDVVAGLAIWGFIAAAIYMMVTGIFGGSVINVSSSIMLIPKCDVTVLTGFCLPLIVGLVKAWAPTDKPGVKNVE
jgi:hypothetical protein